jgi:thiamine biosynthesis lipoprotein
MSSTLCEHSFNAMGGPCEVHFWHEEGQQPDSIQSLLETEVRRLEKKYSRYNSKSLLSKINRGELNGEPLDEEIAGLLNYADQCFELSDHMFDPTVGILRKVWRYNTPKLPDSSELEVLLNDIGWKRLNWNGTSLVLPPKMELDLGGIVKEFAADRLVAILRECGVSGLVNLAGDIAVSGPPPNESAWKIAIKHPRKEGAIAKIKLATGAIAGSGDYERFIEVDGQRYSHLLRPDTGYPAENSFSSVSVIASSCLIAGSVSTVAMLKGGEGLKWLDEMELPYLAFDQSLKAYGSIEA